MSLEKKALNRVLPSNFDPDILQTQQGEIVPKVEFVAHSVDPDEADTYWSPTCDMKDPPTELWYHPKGRYHQVEGCPSKSCPVYLDIIRRFYHVPNTVRVSTSKVWGSLRQTSEWLLHMLRCLIVAMPFMVPYSGGHRSDVGSIRGVDKQIHPLRLAHLIGILVLGYERGMTLDANYLEDLLKPMGSSTSLMCRLIPHNEMAIIKGFASNAHNFKKSYFFLRLDSASVVESCIPIFRRRWNQKGILIGYLSKDFLKTSNPVFISFVLQ